MHKIVPMSEKHIGKVAEIESYSFSEPWSEKAFSETLSDNNYRFYCLVDESENVLGYIGMTVVCGEGEITNVAVDKEYRGQGLGNYLVKEVSDLEKALGTVKLFLEVRESNVPAISAYKKAGFIQNGKRKNFYRKPTEDALLMELNLEEN